MNDKQEIIISYLKETLSQREIYRKTGIVRDTIRKYVREYENKAQQLDYSLTGVDKVDLIEDITKSPKYMSSERTKTAITDEVLDKLKAFLKENETKRLTGFSKQQMKKINMYESLNKDGFNVSYSSIVNAVNKLEKKKKEAYIRQEYIPGDVVEFDFGTVKLYTEDNALREYHLAVFTSAYSNFRWARLFSKQNTACFLEAHAHFFDEIKGALLKLCYIINLIIGFVIHIVVMKKNLYFC